MTAEIVSPELENAKRAAGKLRRLKQVIVGLMIAASVVLVVNLSPVAFATAAGAAAVVLGVGGAVLVGRWLAKKNKPKRDELARILRFLPFAGFGLIPGTPIDYAFLYLMLGVVLGVVAYAVHYFAADHGGHGRKVVMGAMAAGAVVFLMLGAYGYLLPAGPGPGSSSQNTAQAIYGTFTSSQITTDVINQGSVYTACTSLSLPGSPDQTGVKTGALWTSTGYTTTNAIAQSASGTTAGASISIADTITTTKSDSVAGWDTFDCFEVAIAVTLNPTQVPIGTNGAIPVPLSVQLMSVSYTQTVANGTSSTPVNVFYRDTAAGNTQYNWYLLTTNTPNGGSASNSAQLCPGAAGQLPFAVNPSTCPWVSAGTNTGAAASTVKVMFVFNSIGPFGYLSAKNQQFQLQFQVGSPNAWTPVGGTTSYTVPPAVYSIAIVRQ